MVEEKGGQEPGVREKSMWISSNWEEVLDQNSYSAIRLRNLQLCSFIENIKYVNPTAFFYS